MLTDQFALKTIVANLGFAMGSHHLKRNIVVALSEKWNAFRNATGKLIRSKQPLRPHSFSEQIRQTSRNPRLRSG